MGIMDMDPQDGQIGGARLWRNGDYRVLWVGQTCSLVGSQSSWIAYPLLILALTGSPARAGIVSFASWVPYVLFQLPAGALVDRWHRKRTMVVCDAVRSAALASVVVALLGSWLSFWQLVLVAFVERTMSVLFAPAEKAALSRIVPRDQLAGAVAQNDARENLAGVIGPPLGGALFGIARLAPFALDAASYLVSLVMILALRTPLAPEPIIQRRPIRSEIGEGLRFVWRIPFLRASLLQAMGTNVTWSALVLTLIVIARDGGASSGQVGLMLAVFALGGLLGSVISGTILRLLHAPTVVIGSVWYWAALVSLMTLTTNPFVLGLIGGSALALSPAWNGAVVGLTMRLTPDRLQGRVAAVDALVSFGLRPFAMLAVGFILEAVGGQETIVLIALWTAVVAILSTASRGLREAPEIAERPVNAQPAR
jgi:predicted MFS family arabinose efflux permease